jgi:alpha/beta superfamily hydrolase
MAQLESAFKEKTMKGFLFGAWIGSALVIAIENAVSGGINLGIAVWGVATFFGWAVLVFAGHDGRGL